jgi:threonine dehydrogenase-like Zn-dependent dehydrogenase
MQLAGGQTLAVFGQGPVGLSATLLGAKMGARVIAVETSDERLALAKGFGADALVNAAKVDAEKALQELTRGDGVDLALDCTGAAAARRAAVRAVRTWGTACYVGEGGDVTLEVSPDLLRRQVTLIGSWTFSAMGMAECARFIADSGIKLERIFTHRWQLDQVDDAYRVFDRQSSGKGVIEFR